MKRFTDPTIAAMSKIPAKEYGDIARAQYGIKEAKPKKKRYEFTVDFCGGTTGGSIFVNATNSDEAEEIAYERVGKKLYRAFPTLEIDYYLECQNPDEDEEDVA